MKMVNFDIAQALVNYVSRDGDINSLAWGDLSATKIREELCRIRTKNNKVSYQLICDFFAENQTSKMIGNANKKIGYLKTLMEDASNT